MRPSPAACVSRTEALAGRVRRERIAKPQAADRRSARRRDVGISKAPEHRPASPSPHRNPAEALYRFCLIAYRDLPLPRSGNVADGRRGVPPRSGRKPEAWRPAAGGFPDNPTLALASPTRPGRHAPSPVCARGVCVEGAGRVRRENQVETVLLGISAERGERVRSPSPGIPRRKLRGMARRRLASQRAASRAYHSPTATRYSCVRKKITPSEIAGVARQLAPRGLVASSLKSGPARTTCTRPSSLVK